MFCSWWFLWFSFTDTWGSLVKHITQECLATLLSSRWLKNKMVTCFPLSYVSTMTVFHFLGCSPAWHLHWPAKPHILRMAICRSTMCMCAWVSFPYMFLTAAQLNDPHHGWNFTLYIIMCAFFHQHLSIVSNNLTWNTSICITFFLHRNPWL